MNYVVLVVSLFFSLIAYASDPLVFNTQHLGFNERANQLHVATQERNLVQIRALLNHSPQFYFEQNENGEYPIEIAVRTRDVKVLKELSLFCHGFFSDERFNNFRAINRAYNKAKELNYIELTGILSHMLNEAMMLQAICLGGDSLLKVVKYYVEERGVSVNALYARNLRPLDYAKSFNCPKIVAYLNGKGAQAGDVSNH